MKNNVSNLVLHPIPFGFNPFWSLLFCLLVCTYCFVLSLLVIFFMHFPSYVASWPNLSVAFVLLVMLNFIILFMCIVCFMHDHPLHHPSPPSLASIWQVPFFTPPLMFISPSQFKHHATHLPAKFHLFWSWFGWDKKCFKLEPNSNLKYFLAFKISQISFIEYYAGR